MILLELQNSYEHPLINRIIKNYKHLRKRFKKSDTDCFRIYDRDIPEYRISADYYAGKFVFQYYSSWDDGADVPQEIRKTVAEGIRAVFGVHNEDIVWKIRKKRSQSEQYEKLGSDKDYFTSTENGSKFAINVTDYLDNGLFLDHRPVRELVKKISSGKRVLNLFSYTSSITVYAAEGGALSSVSVDMSNTYTSWAEMNFRLNNMDMKKHSLVREDCLKYLERALEECEKFDIVIADPPTLSRSKKMERMFDVNEDHAELITDCSRLLRNKSSVILFSTNSRKFKMNSDLTEEFTIEDISSRSVPEGFRDRKIHKVYIIKFK